MATKDHACSQAWSFVASIGLLLCKVTLTFHLACVMLREESRQSIGEIIFLTYDVVV
jgi:hypothetical protein